MPKMIGFCVLALWLGSGCDDNGGGGDAGVDGGADGSTAGGDGDGTGGMTASGDGDGDGNTGGDGDSGSDAGTTGDGDGDGDGDGIPGSGGDPIDNGFPHDGAQLSTCFRDSECAGDLKCQQPSGNSQVGYCTQTCSNDKDCDDIGGVQTTCGPTGQCEIDCSANGSDGNCPDSMECVSTGFSGMQCTYPEDAGGVKPAWDACDSDLAECGPDLACTRQSLLGLPSPTDILLGNAGGFCTSECSEDADCTNDGGAGGTAACTSMGGFTQYCIIECDDDAQCPGDMVCLFTGLLSASACGY